MEGRGQLTDTMPRVILVMYRGPRTSWRRVDNRKAAPRPRYPIREILFKGANHLDLRPGHFGPPDFTKLDVAVRKHDPNDLGRLSTALPSTAFAVAEIAPGRHLYLGYRGATSQSYLPPNTVLYLIRLQRG